MGAAALVTVIPAQAGIQKSLMDSGLVRCSTVGIPAYAGMTVEGGGNDGGGGLIMPRPRQVTAGFPLTREGR